MRTFCVSDMYMPMLTTLSVDDKLDLIAKLTKTMHMKTKPSKIDIHTCFSGEWNTDKTATQVADELRESRNFSTKEIDW